MSLTLNEVRVPTPTRRAKRIMALLESNGPVNEYDAATPVISPNDGAALLSSAEAGLAMSLADATHEGETIHLKCDELTIPGTDTIVVTPATLDGGTTITFAVADEHVVLIWFTTVGWQARPGFSAAIA